VKKIEKKKIKMKKIISILTMIIINQNIMENLLLIKKQVEILKEIEKWIHLIEEKFLLKKLISNRMKKKVLV